MSDTVRLTEADLRAAIRDARYWQPNPERDAYAAWVTNGYRALGASRLRAADGSAIVHVRAYSRTRNGVVQQVGAHTRAARSVGEGRTDLLIPAGRRSGRRHGRMAEAEVPLLLFNGRRPTTEIAPPLQLLPPFVGGRIRPGPGVAPVAPRVPMQRRAGRSGKENANDVPDWANGRPPYVGEDPNAYAGRLMDEQYPGGWLRPGDRPDSDREFSQISKAHRGYQPPRR